MLGYHLFMHNANSKNDVEAAERENEVGLGLGLGLGLEEVTAGNYAE